MSELVAQLVRASPSDVCRTDRYGFEPRLTHYFLPVPFKLYYISSLSYSVYKFFAKVQWRTGRITEKRLANLKKKTIHCGPTIIQFDNKNTDFRPIKLVAVLRVVKTVLLF